jgi:hypothetical protein
MTYLQLVLHIREHLSFLVLELVAHCIDLLRILLELLQSRVDLGDLRRRLRGDRAHLGLALVQQTCHHKHALRKDQSSAG